jgi:hypothetical protein
MKKRKLQKGGRKINQEEKLSKKERRYGKKWQIRD